MFIVICVLNSWLFWSSFFFTLCLFLWPSFESVPLGLIISWTVTKLIISWDSEVYCLDGST